MEDKFLEIFSTEYLKMLHKEYEHLISETQVSETLTANEYAFTADGRKGSEKAKALASAKTTVTTATNLAVAKSHEQESPI